MRYLGVDNQIDQPLYDTIQLAAAANQVVSFFVTPLGGALTAAIDKTKLHTNLNQASQLEKGVSFTIRALSFIIKNEVAAGTGVSWADYTMIYNMSWIELSIGQQWVLRMPLTQIPPAAGETQYRSNITPAVTEFKAFKGDGNIGNRFVLNNPLQLEDQESFQLDIHCTGTPGAVTDCQMVLWGDYQRPVR